MSLIELYCFINRVEFEYNYLLLFLIDSSFIELSFVDLRKSLIELESSSSFEFFNRVEFEFDSVQLDYTPNVNNRFSIVFANPNTT